MATLVGNGLKKNELKVFINCRYITQVQSPKNVRDHSNMFYQLNSCQLRYDVGHERFWDTIS